MWVRSVLVLVGSWSGLSPGGVVALLVVIAGLATLDASGSVPMTEGGAQSPNAAVRSASSSAAVTSVLVSTASQTVIVRLGEDGYPETDIVIANRLQELADRLAD